MMHELKSKVRKELDNIADKGLTSSNLDTTYKLIDIYKDIYEVCKMDQEMGGDNSYDLPRQRDSRGRYMYYPLDDRTERYLKRIREGMEDYNEGRMRYRDGDSNQRMVEGVEKTMDAILNFVESLMNIAETSQEKEIVRRYVDKIRNV